MKSNLIICSHLRAQFLAVDANFRMKQKEKGLGSSVLGPGWGYFVDPDRLTSELKRVEVDAEIKEARILFWFREFRVW